jgi:protein-L-isoaspartate(D-aspartate) O-methyltransferase
MKPMNDKHLAILRRHMVELVEIRVELFSDELGQDALSEQVLAAMHRVPRHLLYQPSLRLTRDSTQAACFVIL